MRGDYGEVATLISSKGGRVMNKKGTALIDLSDSRLCNNVRIFGE